MLRSVFRIPYSEMGRGPGGADRVGNGDIHFEPSLGEVANDCFRQRVLAAEKRPQIGDIQKERVWRGRVLQADHGTELPALLG